MMKRTLFATTLTAVLAMSAPAFAVTQVFYEDFDGASHDVKGSGSLVAVAGYSDASGFSGKMFRNKSKTAASTVTVSDIGAHDRLLIEFSLALIDSWDGPNSGRWGPDFFNVGVDGATALNASNGLEGDALTFIDRKARGFNARWADRAYTVSFEVAHSAQTAELSFFSSGSGYQGGNDESWAIDSLSIRAIGALPATAPVPLPAGLGLMLGALGLSGLGLRLRRRQTV